MIEVSVEMQGYRVEATIDEGYTYSPAILRIDAGPATLMLSGDDDQLATISEALLEYLRRRGYHDTPDQQMILNAELDRAIEEAAKS